MSVLLSKVTVNFVMFRLVILCTLVNLLKAIPINNGVEGDPEIECGASAISINFNIQNTFEGHVYVKNRYGETDCRNDQVGRKVAGITLPFSTCGVRRTRSINPKGIFVSTTVVISFHPQFLTKIDRAYTIQCFYMEADKTVSAEIEVSMITTGFQTQVVPMPVCRYEILRGGPTGEPIQYAIIGEQVYHKWTCDTETVDTFCMIVQSCFVDDGNGDTVDLIDPNGCALDRYLLNNLEYSTDLMAGQEAHVFKYADRPALFFQCQISITVKEPNQDCPRPECSTLNRGRNKRTVSEQRGVITDVFYGPFNTLDIEATSQTPQLPKHGISRHVSTEDNPVCVSFIGFWIILTLTIGAVIFLIVTAFIYATRSQKSV